MIFHVSNVLPRFATTMFADGREQSDTPCPRCLTGIARVQSVYAPDVGRNWMRCDSCGKQWV